MRYTWPDLVILSLVPLACCARSFGVALIIFLLLLKIDSCFYRSNTLFLRHYYPLTVCCALHEFHSTKQRIEILSTNIRLYILFRYVDDVFGIKVSNLNCLQRMLMTQLRRSVFACFLNLDSFEHHGVPTSEVSKQTKAAGGDFYRNSLCNSDELKQCYPSSTSKN